MPEIVGASAAARALRRAIIQVGGLDTTVLLTGETGAGKGLVARALHRASPRWRGAFVHTDCASLASALLESELFGHERGAFTGADARRAGRFERAARGTIFLDEIGELDPRRQALLLRVLEDREYERVGGCETLAMTARVIAATSRDLRRDVSAGRFRSDLYFRLCVVHLEIPPLRARREDLPALVRSGLARLERRLGVPPPRLAPAQLERLASCPWRGNVRELFNALERLAICCPGRDVRASELEAALADALGALPTAVGALVADAPTFTDSDAMEPIASALRATRGNVAQAARRLGMARSTLRRRIDRYGLRAAPPSGQVQSVPQHQPQCHQREYALVEPGEGGLAHAPRGAAADPAAHHHRSGQQRQGAGEPQECEPRCAEHGELDPVAEGLTGGLGADDALA
ncbi:MAG TPA: sigma-54 dependent transcriptional regulator [Myxococcota bacterium]